MRSIFDTPGRPACWLAIAYLLAHTGMLCAAPHRLKKPSLVLLTNAILIFFFLALALSSLWPENFPENGLRSLRLWIPLIFFWWAYKWTGKTLELFYPAGFSLDPAIIRIEERYLGQPSLRAAGSERPWLTEICHFFYATYYFYTPVLAIYLQMKGRYLEFEAMSFAVMLSYAVAYVTFALAPVWGPRWGLVQAGLLQPARQRLKGYALTRLINYIMYEGLAHKGGAMPSAHSSTAVVFLFWSWQLGGASGGIPATLLVLGMGAGSIYGRYHYVFDIVCGVLLGAACIWVANFLILGVS